MAKKLKAVVINNESIYGLIDEIKVKYRRTNPGQHQLKWFEVKSILDKAEKRRAEDIPAGVYPLYFRAYIHESFNDRIKANGLKNLGFVLVPLSWDFKKTVAEFPSPSPLSDAREFIFSKEEIMYCYNNACLRLDTKLDILEDYCEAGSLSNVNNKYKNIPSTQAGGAGTLRKNVDIRDSKRPSDEELENRIRTTPATLGTRHTSVTLFKRNQNVKELAKRRAKGVCQLCEIHAPFNDKEGNPFLETHHIIPRADGGEDTIENVVALCPNCHRKMHILSLESDIAKLKEKAGK